ncbi:hypothetical protein CCS38_21145 [Streptomyces purpurogeneiscleroticus]|nr:hypothetical protein [Streptomyces purpurogeneiscleroticus]
MPCMVIGEQQHERVTIAAKRPERYHWILAGVLVAVGLPAGFLLGSVRLLIAAATALICVLVLVRIGKACSVTVTEKDVQYRGILGRTRRIPRGDIATVLYAPHLDTGYHQHSDWLVLLDEHGRQLLRLTSHSIWPQEEVRRVCDAVGGPTVYLPDTQARALRRNHPQAMPYHVAHPAISGCLLAALIIAVVAVGVIAVTVLNS